jgi:hypothetical protein
MEQITPEDEEALEDAEDIAIAEARMNDPNDGVVPWEQVKAEAEAMEQEGAAERSVRGDGGRDRFPDRGTIEVLVGAALDGFMLHDADLLYRNASEWAISHKFAEHLQRRFPYWHVDCEYNRRGDAIKQQRIGPSGAAHSSGRARRVRPDIIVHRRGVRENLLVVEVKKCAGCSPRSLERCLEDQKELREFTRRDGKDAYRCGLFIAFTGRRGGGPFLHWYPDAEARQKDGCSG